MHAGRVLSRKSRRRGRAGRTFSRKCHWRGGAGRVISRQPALRRSWRRRGALQVGGDGGFALHEALLRRVASVSNPRVVQFPPFGGSSAANTASCRSSCSAIPPFGGGAAVVRGGMAPTSQTTSMNHADNVLLVAKWSAFWAHQCLAVVWYSHASDATAPPKQCRT